MLFFYNDTATTEIYTLSLHDARPIYAEEVSRELESLAGEIQELSAAAARVNAVERDRTVVEHRLVHLGGVVEDGARPSRKSQSPKSSYANILSLVFFFIKKNVTNIAS